MDGYTKHHMEKNLAIKHGIWAKYAITLPLVVFIFLALLLTFTDQPPNEWQKKEIVFSHLFRERIGVSLFDSNVLYTQSGEKYAIRKDAIADGLTAGNTYILVYSRANTIEGICAVEALSDENMIYQDLNASIARWEKEQAETIYIVLGLCMMELIALLIIDRLWCKKDHAQIKELQAKITRRKDYSANHRNSIRRFSSR